MRLSRIFSAARLLAIWLRSFYMRCYLRLAYRGISCHPSVRFGRGVTIRCFEGGSLVIGAGSVIHEYAMLIAEGGRLDIGTGCLINRGCVLVCTEEIRIGTGTLIAEYVTIRDHDHRHDKAGGLDAGGLVSSPIHIENDVWLGAKATVTRGVSIVSHSIIGANSVVTRPLTTRGVYAGAPAQLRKTL